MIGGPPNPTPIPSVPPLRPPTIAVGGPLSTVYFGGGGITPVDLLTTPWDYPERRGAIGDGVHDDTDAILATIDASPWTVLRKATYRVRAPITGPINRIVTAPFGVATLKPDAATVATFRPNSNWIIDGVWLDGINTNGAMGLDLGVTAFTNIVKASNMQIFNYLGVGGRGIGLGDLITGTLYDLLVSSCYDGMLVQGGGGGGPTNILVVGSQFRTASRNGVRMLTGTSINFLKSLFEANTLEGFYAACGAGVIDGIDFDKCWFEGNYPAGYHANFDGTGGGVLRAPAFRKCQMQGLGGSGVKAIHFNQVLDWQLDNNAIVSRAGNVLLDGIGNGSVVNWRGISGPMFSTINDTNGQVADSLWSSYAPVYGGLGAMTLTAVTTGKARYFVKNKTITIHLYFFGTTGGVANTGLTVTLPSSYGSFDNLLYASCSITNDGGATFTPGLARPKTGAPGVIEIYNPTFANWALGAGRGVTLALTFEIA